jgi:hypothetical protein
MLDSAAEGVKRFLSAATGSEVDSLGGVMEGATKLMERLSDASRGLVPVAESIGKFVAKIAGGLDTLASGLERIRGVGSEFEPEGGFARFTKGLLFDDRMAVEDVKRKAVERVLMNAGLPQPNLRYVQGASPDDVYRDEGFRAFWGQSMRRMWSGRGAEQVPVLDFSRYPDARAKLVAEKLAAFVDGLDERTVRSPGAFNDALKGSGLLDKLDLATGRVPASATPALMEVLKREGLTPNLAAEASSTVQLLGRVSALRNTERDPLRRLLGQGESVFSSNLGTTRDPFTAGDVFKRLDATYGREADLYMRALGEARDPGQAGAVRRDFDKLHDRYRAVREQIEGQFIGTAQDFGLALVEASRGLPANVRSLILSRVSEGATAFGENIKRVLVSAGMEGGEVDRRLGNLPLRDRLSIESGRFDATVADLRRGYGFAVGASADDIERAVMRGPASLGTINSRIGGYIRGGPMERQRELYREALKAYNPADESSVIALGEAQESLVKVTEAIRDLRDQLDTTKQAFVDFGTSVHEDLSKGIEDSIYNIITGTGSMKDVLVGFASDVTRAFSKMSANFLMGSLFGDPAQGGGIGGIFGELFKGMGGGGGGGGGTFGLFGDIFGGGKKAATGAVWDGGFTPVAAFASGGVVDRPVIGIVGEGSAPAEAMVPLPDGERIPVQFLNRGAGEGGWYGNLYVVQNPSEAFKRGFNANKDVIYDGITGEIMAGRKVHRAMRAKGV